MGREYIWKKGIKGTIHSTSGDYSPDVDEKMKKIKKEKKNVRIIKINNY